MSIERKDLLIGILRNENPDSARDWIAACLDYGLDFKVIDISSAYWTKEILSEPFDFFVIQPGGLIEQTKKMFDEKMYIVSKVLKLNLYPSYEECILYENKKMLSYYLQAKNIPHPSTLVFYDYKEAKRFLNDSRYPLVAKTAIGAAGSGVKFLKNKNSALSYLKGAFKGKGIHRRFGPNRVMGSPGKWLLKALRSPEYFSKKLKLYLKINREIQRDYVIFQEYIPHDFEWRLIKIDRSFFAHKKIKVDNKASGAKVKEFGMPDVKLMNYFEEICEKNNFNAVNIDLFEREGEYLVNEIQCIFGIPYGYLMKVDNKIGRIVKKDGKWLFEEGDFTKNNCCNLRLEAAVRQFGFS